MIRSAAIAVFVCSCALIISAPGVSAAVSCPGLPFDFTNKFTAWQFDTDNGICTPTNSDATTNGFRIDTHDHFIAFIRMFTDEVTQKGNFDGDSTVYAAHSVTAVSITGTPGNNINATVSDPAGVGVYKVIFTNIAAAPLEQTYTMKLTKDGVSYTITVTGTFEANGGQTMTSMTVTGGAFGGAGVTADDTQAVTAAFADAGVRTHNWSTQTQVLGRLFAGTNGDDNGGASFAPNVARPSGLNFHSAEILNDMQARRLRMLAESYSEIQNSYYYGENNSDETTQLDAQVMANLALASQSADGTGLYDVWASGGYAEMELSTPGAAYDGQLFYGRVGADYKINDNTLVGLGFGYEAGQADVVLDNTDYNSEAFSLAGYLGVKLADMLLFDGSVGYAFVNYDFEGDNNSGNFDAGRLFATANLTGVYDIQDILQIRPKVGLLYWNERQQAYTDGGGTANAARTLQLGRLSFGGEVHFTGSDNRVRPYITAQGEWDFIRPDAVTLSNGFDYRADELGASAGAGMIVDLMPNLQGSVEASLDSIGREDFDAWSTRGRIIYLF